MIHPALLTLIKLRIRAGFRRVLRSLKRPRGVLLFAFWLFLIGCGIVSFVCAAASDPFAHLPIAAAEFISLGLMVLSVWIIVKSSGESAIYFTPSEIDFLFSGPFSRRDLLVFRLAANILPMLFVSLMFSAFLAAVAKLWVACFVGILLTLLLLQLLGMSVALIKQTISEHIYTRARKAIVVLVLLLLAPAVWQALVVGMQQNWLQMVQRFRESLTGAVLLAPFEVFSHTIMAERLFPDLLAWGALALTIDLALLAVVLRLDANYLEAAAAVSQKLYDRLERMKRGGSVLVLAKPVGPRWTLPRLPWLGGAGPIAWRQLTIAFRTSRSLLVMTVLMFAVSGAMMAVIDHKSPGSIAAPLMGIGIIGYMTFIVGMCFFPHDLDHIDWLKSLPLRSTAIACGELSGVVSLLTMLEVLYFCLAAVWLSESAIILIGAAVFVLPFNLVLFAVENLVFLLYPARMIPNTPGDFQHVGRHMVFMLLKMITLVICFGSAAGIGAIVFTLTGQSGIAFAAANWVALLLETVVLVQLVAWAFRRFDPSIDTPP